MSLESNSKIGASQGADKTQAASGNVNASLVKRFDTTGVEQHKQILNVKSEISAIKADITTLKADLTVLESKKVRSTTLGFVNAMKNIGTFVSNCYNGNPVMFNMRP